MTCYFNNTKKFFSCLFFVLLLNNAHSKDLYTWGFAGDDCKLMNVIINEYGKEGQIAMKSAVRGFLTGYNLTQPRNKTRVINSNSSDYVIAYLKEFCRKQGDDGRIFDALITYYKTLRRIN